MTPDALSVYATTFGYLVAAPLDEPALVTRCKTSRELYCHECKQPQRNPCVHVTAIMLATYSATQPED